MASGEPGSLTIQEVRDHLEHGGRTGSGTEGVRYRMMVGRNLPGSHQRREPDSGRTAPGWRQAETVDGRGGICSQSMRAGVVRGTDRTTGEPRRVPDRTGGSSRQDTNPAKRQWHSGSGRADPEVLGSGILIQITPQLRILVAIESIDARKGIESIAQLCREKLSADPFSGCLFIFRSRRGTAIKLLAYPLCQHE